MSKHIYSDFNKLRISVSPRMISTFKKIVTAYELRGTHPEGFNTALLGIAKVHFLPQDYDALFDTFDVDERDFKQAIKHCSGIDKTRRVTSDPYNVLTLWLMHKIRTSGLSVKDKEDGLFLITKMLCYKFFTSIVNHNFPYGSNEAVMMKTIEGLSNKFDIKNKETSTWALLLAKVARDAYDPKGIHADIIKNPNNDDRFLRVIADISGRIKSRTKLITAEYRTNLELGKGILGTKIVGEIEGDKTIRAITGSFEQMINGVYGDILNVNELLQEDILRLVAGLNNKVKVHHLKHLLSKISTIAVDQYKHGKQNDIKGKDEELIYIGVQGLVSNVIQKVYRLCIADKEVNMHDKRSILDKTRNIFRSSVIADPDVTVMKNSITTLIEQVVKSDSAIPALRIAFAMVLIILSFKYI